MKWVWHVHAGLRADLSGQGDEVGSCLSMQGVAKNLWSSLPYPSFSQKLFFHMQNIFPVSHDPPNPIPLQPWISSTKLRLVVDEAQWVCFPEYGSSPMAEL